MSATALGPNSELDEEGTRQNSKLDASNDVSES